jgi:hypothetical protein
VFLTQEHPWSTHSSTLDVEGETILLVRSVQNWCAVRDSNPEPAG